MDALARLRRQQDEIRRLIGGFRSARAAGDPARMQDLRPRILDELTVHIAVEEQALYPLAREAGGRMDDRVIEGRQEHMHLDRLMQEIAQLDLGRDERWITKMELLIEHAEQHVEQAEAELFPRLHEALGGAVLMDLARRVATADREYRRARQPPR